MLFGVKFEEPLGPGLQAGSFKFVPPSVPIHAPRYEHKKFHATQQLAFSGSFCTKKHFAWA